jgi:hypothetical protein
MYNKLRRLTGNFQTMQSQVSDGAGGVTAASRSGYGCRIYLKSTSSFYGNYGGIRNEEGGQVGTDQSFEGMIRYTDYMEIKSTTVLIVRNQKYTLSDIENVDFKNQWIKFKATIRND